MSSGIYFNIPSYVEPQGQSLGIWDHILTLMQDSGLTLCLFPIYKTTVISVTCDLVISMTYNIFKSVPYFMFIKEGAQLTPYHVWDLLLQLICYSLLYPFL